MPADRPHGAERQRLPSPTIVFRYPLAQAAAWLAARRRRSAAQCAAPEIILTQTLPRRAALDASPPSLLDRPPPTPTSPSIRSPGRWSPRSTPASPTQWDILTAIDGRAPIRFGNNVFGACAGRWRPVSVSPTAPASAPPATSQPTASPRSTPPDRQACSAALRNPFAVTNGADAETASTSSAWRRRRSRRCSIAPSCAKDYEAAAETLPWVHKAGTAFRWTGSWMTVFTAADPAGSERRSASTRTSS